MIGISRCYAPHIGEIEKVDLSNNLEKCFAYPSIA